MLSARAFISASVLAVAHPLFAQQSVVTAPLTVNLNTACTRCPSVCTLDQTIGPTPQFQLPKFNPALGSLRGIDLQVSASINGSFHWQILAAHAVGGYAANARLRTTTTPTGASSMSTDHTTGDCGTGIPSNVFEGNCTFPGSGGSSPTRAVNSSSFSSYTGSGNLAVPVSVRFSGQLFTSGVAFMDWRDELAAGLTLTATYTYCGPDFNRDGDLNPDDLADYISCYYNLPCQGSDFNLDGNTDPDDLADFIAAYFNGCP